jgi:hypothetical protein
MTRRVKTIKPATIEAMIEETDELLLGVSAIRARFHEDQQTRWLGGDRAANNYEEPCRRAKRAFDEWKNANDALSRASHHLAMLSVGVTAEEIPCTEES